MRAVNTHLGEAKESCQVHLALNPQVVRHPNVHRIQQSLAIGVAVARRTEVKKVTDGRFPFLPVGSSPHGII
jgi:hypothetical protein